MILKKLNLENIRSYEKEEINFTIGSTLLSGDIGSGKTTVLLAIEFGLFGLQPGQRGSAILRNGAEEGKIILEFEVEGKNIIVERNLKRGKTISQGASFLTVDGEKQELAVTELKARILNLLDYPSEFSKKQNLLYKFTVYTPQEEMKQIVLEDPQIRLNTLRHVFGIDKYKKVLENVSILRTSLREEIRLLEGMTSSLEGDKKNLEDKQKFVESKKEDLKFLTSDLKLKIERRELKEREKEEVSKKLEERNKLKEEIAKSKVMLMSKKDTYSSNEKLVSSIKKELEEFSMLNFDETKIMDFENEMYSLKKEITKIQEKILETNSNIKLLITKQEDAKKIQSKISDLETCPTCHQNVDAVYRANVLNKAHNDITSLENTLQELEAEKKRFKEELVKKEVDLNFKEKEITNLKILKMKLESIKEKQKNLENLENSNKELEKDLTFLTNHVSDLNDSILRYSTYEKIFEDKLKELTLLQKEERLADIKLAEAKKEIDVFLDTIEELKKRIKKTEESKIKLQKISEIEFWLNKNFTPLISFVERNVMNSLKYEFSNLFSEWFNILVPEEFNVRLSDDFTPIIEQKDYEIDYQYLSGGERTASALAYRLALNQVINSLMSKIKTKELVILDEPTDGFSSEQLDKMREVLEQLDVKQLIIVSHEQKIESFVENVIKFKKENGISQKQ
jgi:exonuclease SbcC